MYPPAIQNAPFSARSPLDRVLAPLDRVCTVPLTLLALPVLGAAAVAVAILSGQSPFVAHLRVGRRWTPLWMWKLRTMWDPAARWSGLPRSFVEYIADEAGPTRKRHPDPRVAHPFAAFCRRHSIDELPQLFHVVRGEMSLVGPRPLTRGELQANYGEAADEILEVNPGITGLWQVGGRSRLTYRQRREMDLLLVRNRSARLYLKILTGTIREVLTGRNAW
jgi:exopolysaccharide production protein ExoY